MSERKHGFRFTSIIIALAMIMGSLGILIGPMIPSVSASITGDAYSGSGNWTINNPTVYTGETLTVYGNITINGGGSLTLSNTHLTIDQPSDYYYTIKWGMTDPDPFLKVTAASIIDTTNATSGKSNLMLNCQGHGYLQVDNSTLSNVIVAVMATPSIAQPSYVSYSTLVGSLVWNQFGLFYELAEYLDAGPLTLNHNLIRDSNVGHSIIPDTYSLINLASHAVVVENTFQNISLGTRATDAGSYIRSNAQHAVTISRNVFADTTFGLIFVRGYSTYYANDSHIDDNIFGTIGGPNPATATTGIYLRDTAGSSTSVNGNHFEAVKNGSIGIHVYGHDWVLVQNEFEMIDASGLIGVGSSSGIVVDYSADVTVHGTIVHNAVGPGIDNGSSAVGVYAMDSGNIVISHSIISNLSNVCGNGVVASDTPGFSYIGGYQIFANTITNIREASNGIYVTGPTGGVVSWNNVSNVGAAATGIMFHFTTHAISAHNNSVVGSFYESNIWPAWSISPAAYSVCAGNSWNVSFKDNHAEGFAWTPTYDFTAEKLGGGYWPQMNVKLDVSEYAIVRMIGANVTLTHDERALLIVRDGVDMSMRHYANGTSWAWFNKTDVLTHYLNITPTNLAIAVNANHAADVKVSVTLPQYVAKWDVTGNSGTALTFTLSNQESGKTYKLYVDGVLYQTRTASSAGVVSFTYSGSWSTHQFEVQGGMLPGNVQPFVVLIIVLFGLVIAMQVIAFALSSKDQGISKEDVVLMVIFLVVSLVLMGLLIFILGPS